MQPRSVLFLLLAAFIARAEEAAAIGKAEPSGSQEFLRFDMKKQPTLRLGKLLRIDFKARLQEDFRSYSEDLGPEQPWNDLRRFRVGIEGRFLRNFEFEVEHDLNETSRPLRDAYLNFRYRRYLQVRGGRFNIPFSSDQLTGSSRLVFIHRSLGARYLAPGRDTGVSIHGRLFERALGYEAGIFRTDGDNAQSKDHRGSGETTLAGRITGAPLKKLELGLAFATSAVPEGLNSLRGRTTTSETFFDRINVNGRRVRLGTELRWSAGPLTFANEFIAVREQRLGQGLLGEDLPDLEARSWYVSGVWRVPLGKPSERPLELAARFEQIRFGGGTRFDEPARGPRAANIFSNQDRAQTYGVNWRWNRHFRLQFNLVREHTNDPERRPFADRNGLWSRLCSLQFTL